MSFGEINKFHQELEALETQNLGRNENSSRDDLLTRSALLEAQARRLGLPKLIAAALLQRGAILNSAARWQESIETIQKAYRILLESRHWEPRVNALSKLAEAYSGLKVWSEVNNICAEGIELVEKNRNKVNAPYMQSAYLRFRTALYRLGVWAAYELGDVLLLLQRAEMAKARGMLRWQLGGFVDNPGLENLRRRFIRASKRLEELVAVNAHEEDLRSLREERRRLGELMAVSRSAHISGEELAVFDLEKVQQCLAVDEVIIYYYWLDVRELLIVTIDANYVELEQRTLSREQQRELSEDTNQVLSLVPGAGNPILPNSFFTKWAWLLPEALIQIETRVTDDQQKKRLLISPHQMLHALPFHAFQWQGAYLIERFAVTYIPNLTSLQLLYQPKEQKRVLTIGISKFDMPGLPVRPLPQAEEEARTVANLYWNAGVNSTTLCNADACINRLRRWSQIGLMNRFSCIHLVSHADNIVADTPLESHLYLYDAVLDGLEIADWQLSAELIVLSACSAGQRAVSGRGLKDVPGDELFGLQAALFAAGSRCIISPLWPVLDKVALRLMRILHSFLTRGCTVEVAYQQAIKEFLENDPGIKWRRPFYWAPFYVTTFGRPLTGS
jgi:CHAT domain-containing protein